MGAIKQPQYMILFMVSLIVDWACGVLMERYPKYKKGILVFGILYHLGWLFYYKYAGFVFKELGRVIPGLSVNLSPLLPIGISFYTFQGISYIIDVYRGTVKADHSLLRVGTYISMFEQLIAGPIVTYSDVQKEMSHRSIRCKEVLKGMGVFVIGLGLKVLLANQVGGLWTDMATIGYESISTPLAWMGIIAFTFQIYFDFFGYSLMAVGLGKMMGFAIPKNFDHPYTSLTMTEFWRRWHITLGSWFREYVYISVGGNRKGTWKTIRNLLLVWALTGIWHGAGYNFLLWGLSIFVLIILEKYLIGNFLNKHPFVGHVYMIVLIPLSWLLFVVEDMQQLAVYFTRLFPFFGESMWGLEELDYLRHLGMYWPFLLAGVVFSMKWPYRLLQRIKSKVLICFILLVIFGASVYCMYKGFNDPFLYFRF